MRFLDAVARLVEAYLPLGWETILARLLATNHMIWNTGSEVRGLFSRTMIHFKG
jgi:hypothetical protein